MKKIIQELNQRETELRTELGNIEKAIRALQTVCEHKKKDGEDAFEYEGHDSHNDFYKCTECGIDRRG